MVSTNWVVLARVPVSKVLHTVWTHTVYIELHTQLWKWNLNISIVIIKWNNCMSASKSTKGVFKEEKVPYRCSKKSFNTSASAFQPSGPSSTSTFLWCPSIQTTNCSGPVCWKISKKVWGGSSCYWTLCNSFTRAKLRATHSSMISF